MICSSLLDDGFNMGFAIKYTTEKTGVSSKSVKKIVKEKIIGPLRDNKSLRNRLTNDEKLSNEEIEKIRKVIHEEFDKFIKKPGKRVSLDARYPTIGNIQQSQCLKITVQVTFNIASKAIYAYILSGQKLIKNAENGQF